MKALVTGSSGFIGSHLVTALIRQNWEVHALLRGETTRGRLSHQGMILHGGDYSDESSLARAVEGMDHVFHLGARLKGRKWEEFYRSNALATQKLLEACRQANPNLKRFIYVSSIAACGPASPGQPKTEAETCQPVSLYGKSKLEGEGFCREYMNRLPLVIVRPPNVLGPGQKELMATIALIDKHIFPLLGNGKPQTSICFVEDLVRAFIQVAQDDRAIGETYFVTTPGQYAWREIMNVIVRELGKTWMIRVPFPLLYLIGAVAEGIARLTGATPFLTRGDITSARHNDWLFDGGKIERDLGFHAELDLNSGIHRIVKEYRRH